MSRDHVVIEPNERVDRPDFEEMEYNLRSEARSLIRDLCFGGDPTTSRVKRILGGWSVNGIGTNVSVVAGAALGIEILPSTDIDAGVTFGWDPGIQAFDMTGQPNGTYNVYVAFKQDPGQPGSRVFWNDDTQSEEAAMMDTRLIVGWDLFVTTGVPGTGWLKIAEVLWNGVTVTVSRSTQHMFFEGDEGATPTAFPEEWGDGANDRSLNRSVYGVFDLYRWVHAVRRQLKDIIEGGATGKWYSAITGESLNVHTLKTTNPHGTAPIWTGTPKAPNWLLTSALSAYWGITGAGCHPWVSVPAMTNYLYISEDSAIRFSQAGGGTGNILYVPVEVPNGTYLDELSNWSEITAIAVSNDVDVSFFKRLRDGSAASVLIAATTNNGVLGRRERTANLGLEQVNRQDYNYYLTIRLRNTAANTSTLYSVRIKYVYTKVIPTYP